MATRRHSRGSGPPAHIVIAWAHVARPATGPCRVYNPTALSRATSTLAASKTSRWGDRRKQVRFVRHPRRMVLVPVSTRVGGAVRGRDLAMGMLLACTSLVANAVVSGDGSLASRTAATLPEPFTIQDAAAGPHWGGGSVVATPTAFASAVHPLTGSGLAVPGTATGQSDGGSLERDTDGAVAPSGAVPAAPVEDPVAVSPDTSPVEPVLEVPGDELEGPVAPVLQPVTELLLAPTGVTEATDPALSMLGAPIFA